MTEAGNTLDDRSLKRTYDSVRYTEQARRNNPKFDRDTPILQRPPLRVMLLDDLAEGRYVFASIQKCVPTKRIQTVVLPAAGSDGQLTETTVQKPSDPTSIQTLKFYGFNISGEFALDVDGEQTPFMPFHASAATVKSELESLSMFVAGDIIVKWRPGTYWIHYTGQFTGTIPTITGVTKEGVTQKLQGQEYLGFDRTTVDVLTDTTIWVDTQQLEKVTPGVPPPAGYPIKAGTVCVAIPFEVAGYVVIETECRDYTSFY